MSYSLNVLGYEYFAQPDGQFEQIHSKVYWTIIRYYSVWEEAELVPKESDIRARLIGVGSQMTTFDFYFGVYLGEMVLRHTDNLSKTLQKKELSATEGQQVSSLVKVTLQSMHSAEHFDLFWKTLIKKLKV